MTKFFNYAMLVLLRIPREKSKVSIRGEAIKEHLQNRYIVYKFEYFNDPDVPDEWSFTFQIGMTFDETEMDEDEEPSEYAIEGLTSELKSHFETDFAISSIEVLDDTFQSYRLDEWEE